MSQLDTRDLNKRLEELNDIETQINDIEEEITSVKDEILQLEEDHMKCDAEVSDDLSDDIVDAKDRLEGLENELDDCRSDYDEGEHDELKDMENNISGFSDGVQLIPEDEFVEYVQELLVDCGDLPDNIPWYITIDWDDTAHNIRHDYSSIDYQGESYLYRD